MQHVAERNLDTDHCTVRSKEVHLSPSIYPIPPKRSYSLNGKHRASTTSSSSSIDPPPPKNQIYTTMTEKDVRGVLSARSNDESSLWVGKLDELVHESSQQDIKCK